MLELETLSATRANGFVYDFRALPPVQAGDAWQVEFGSVPQAPVTRSSALQGARASQTVARSVISAGTSLVFQARAGLIANGPRSSVVGVGRRELGSASVTLGTATNFYPDPSLTAPYGDNGSADETDAGTGTESLPAGYTWVDPNTLQPVSDPRLAQSAATSCRATESTFWLPVDSYKYNFVPTKWGKTQGKAQFRWDISSSKQTQLSIALNVAGTWSKQGLTGSLQQDTSMSWAPTLIHNMQQLWKMTWEYRKEQKMCQPAVQEQQAYGLNVSRWVPNRPTGGNRMDNTTASKACGGTGPAFHDPFSATTSLTTNTTVTLSGFFEIGGIQLDAQQATGSSQTFSIIPDSGKTAHACGNDDSPLYAHFAKEDGD